MNDLIAKDLFVGYTNKMIIEDLNVSLPEGEITTIIGPNGCGKSTLLKTMSRISKHQKGTVLLDGKDIHSLKIKKILQNKLRFYHKALSALLVLIKGHLIWIFECK